MLSAVFVLLVLSILVTIMNWRVGMLCFVATGFLQDPLRKLAEGHSVYFTLAAGVVFLVVLLSAWTRMTPNVAALFGNNHRLEQAWKLFIFVCLLQIAHSFLRWGNPYLVALGALTYFLPIGALLIGIYYAKSPDRVERFLNYYCLFAVPTALTVYLSFWFSNDWKILQDLGAFFGQELRIYGQGTVLASNPGLFRVGEIAAWHAATAAAFCIAFGLRNDNFPIKLLYALLVALLIGAIILTGRRKMLIAIIVFAGSYGALLMYLRQGITKNVVFLCLAVACASLLVIVNEPDTTQLVYVRHSVSVFEQLYDRAELSILLFFSGLFKFDFMGAGAGVSAQGAQYFGGGVSIVGGSAESGLGKIASELGLPGILAAVFLWSVLIRHLLSGVRYVSTHAPHLTDISVALFSLLIANAATFFVATQVFGDLFILLLLGVFAGFLIAFPWLAYQKSLQGSPSNHVDGAAAC